MLLPTLICLGRLEKSGEVAMARHPQAPKPKQVLTAYHFFLKAVREATQAELPDAHVSGELDLDKYRDAVALVEAHC